MNRIRCETCNIAQPSLKCYLDGKFLIRNSENRLKGKLPTQPPEVLR